MLSARESVQWRCDLYVRVILRRRSSIFSSTYATYVVTPNIRCSIEIHFMKKCFTRVSPVLPKRTKDLLRNRSVGIIFVIGKSSK